MPTVSVNLVTNDYVKINNRDGSFTIQSHRDTVRIAFSNVGKPSVNNIAFHELGGAGKESILNVPYTRDDIYVIAMSDKSSLSITSHEDPHSIMSDAAGRRASVSMSNETIVGHREDEISINFHYGVSDRDIKDGGAVTGTASISSSNSMVNLSTGIGVGSAEIRSLRSIRYRSGHETYCSPSVVFATPELNVNQYIGFLDDNNKYCIGYQGLNVGLWFVKSGSVLFVQQSEWNIDKCDGLGRSGYNVDFQKAQVPELKYVWHGFKNLMLELVLPNGDTVPIHKFEFINTNVTPHLDNPSLPMAARIERVSGSGANLTMSSGSWRAGVVTPLLSVIVADRRFEYPILEKSIAAGKRDVVMGLRSRSVHQSLDNHVTVEITFIEMVSDGNKTVIFEFWDASQGAFSVPLIYADKDVQNSVMQYSTTVSEFTPTVGQDPRSAFVLNKVDSKDINTRDQGLLIHPQDERVVTARSTQSSEVSLVMRTFEKF